MATILVQARRHEATLGDASTEHPKATAIRRKGRGATVGEWLGEGGLRNNHPPIDAKKSVGWECDGELLAASCRRGEVQVEEIGNGGGGGAGADGVDGGLGDGHDWSEGGGRWGGTASEGDLQVGKADRSGCGEGCGGGGGGKRDDRFREDEHERIVRREEEESEKRLAGGVGGESEYGGGGDRAGCEDGAKCTASRARANATAVCAVDAGAGDVVALGLGEVEG